MSDPSLVDMSVRLTEEEIQEHARAVEGPYGAERDLLMDIFGTPEQVLNFARRIESASLRKVAKMANTMLADVKGEPKI